MALYKNAATIVGQVPKAFTVPELVFKSMDMADLKKRLMHSCRLQSCTGSGLDTAVERFEIYRDACISGWWSDRSLPVSVGTGAAAPRPAQATISDKCKEELIFASSADSLAIPIGVLKFTDFDD